MISITLTLAAIGAFVVARLAVKGVRQFLKDLRAKPTRWLDIPRGW